MDTFFDKAVEANPTAIAVEDHATGLKLSYTDLQTWSRDSAVKLHQLLNRHSHTKTKQKVEGDELGILLCVSEGLEMVVLIMAFSSF
mmetsp:Transcript_5554/g.11636  ORF Transcript_5554/g.11636 Transcript_5554/m.11636 type:complete len:87 (-) Transcript_5554:10-270(-)